MDVSPSGNCSQEFVHYGDKIPACTFLFCPFMACVLIPFWFSPFFLVFLLSSLTLALPVLTYSITDFLVVKFCFLLDPSGSGW